MDMADTLQSEKNDSYEGECPIENDDVLTHRPRGVSNNIILKDETETHSMAKCSSKEKTLFMPNFLPQKGSKPNSVSA